MRRLLAAVSLWLLLAAAAAAQVQAEPSIEVRLEPQRLGVEDLARLTVIVWGVNQGATLQLGELSNLQVLAGPFTKQQLSWVNGVATASIRYTYHLRPQAVGPASVGAVIVSAGTSRLTAPPVAVEVVAGSLQAAREQRRLQRSSLAPVQGGLAGPDLRESRLEPRLLVDNLEPYLGQPVMVTLVLDTNMTRVASFDLAAPPSFPGWWAQRVEPSAAPSTQVVEVEGARLFRHVVLRYVLVPLKTGELTLPSLKALIGVRGRSVFSPGQRLTRPTKAVQVHVRERPAAPATFAGGVGTLRYRVELTPQSITFGESAVLSIELSGTGNLPLVTAPARWPGCRGCDTYPPEEQSRLQIDETGIHGTRTWRTTVVPRQWGVLQLAPVQLASFDPRAGEYRLHELGELTLEVAAPSATPTPVTDQNEQQAGGQQPAGAPSAWIRVAWIAGPLLVGLVAGVLLTRLLGTRHTEIVPQPSSATQTPAERARELQQVLERWWAEHGTHEPSLRRSMEQLRGELETVRFAPGRADHTYTVRELERRLKRLVRQA